MTTAPGPDERRIRRALDARGVSYAPQPPATPVRERDWLDDLMDAEPMPRTAPPAEPPAPPKQTAREDTPGEPRWDWRRLLHWPYAWLTWSICMPLIPWYRGQSAATAWGDALRSCRSEASVGAAWILAGTGIGVAAVLVHRGRWYGWLLLTPAFVGTVAMASPYDLVTLITGVTK